MTDDITSYTITFSDGEVITPCLCSEHYNEFLEVWEAYEKHVIKSDDNMQDCMWGCDACNDPDYFSD